MSAEIGDDLCVVPVLMIGGDEQVNGAIRFRMLSESAHVYSLHQGQDGVSSCACTGNGRASRTPLANLSAAVGKGCESPSGLFECDCEISA